MKIAHISTYELKGGAANATYRLHKSLINTGIHSRLHVRDKNSTDNETIQHGKKNDLLSRFKRKIIRHTGLSNKYYQIEKIQEEWGPFSNIRSSYLNLFDEINFSDIYHLHWVRGFLDFSSFFAQLEKPVVWTMHDMNPFTGGCHVAFNCSRFKESCGKCPHIYSDLSDDLSYHIWREKRKYYNKLQDSTDIVFVAPSKHHLRLAKSSTILHGQDVRVIYNGIDTKIFKPYEGNLLRSVFSIESEEKIILFVAETGKVRYKGLKELKKIVNSLNHSTNIHLVTIGKDMPRLSQHFKQTNLGTIQNNKILAAVYSSADLFIMPSLQESFGLTAIESMSCGTPVAAFETGVIPEAIRNNVTGIKAPVGSIKEIKKGVEYILDNDAERKEMSKKARNKVVEKFNIEMQSRKYLELYKEILNK